MSKVNRTKQNQLQLKANESKREWDKCSNRTIKLQEKITALTKEMKDCRKEQNKHFKDYQGYQKKAFEEKQKNDKQVYIEKLKERQKKAKQGNNKKKK